MSTQRRENRYPAATICRRVSRCRRRFGSQDWLGTPPELALRSCEDRHSSVQTAPAVLKASRSLATDSLQSDHRNTQARSASLRTSAAVRCPPGSRTLSAAASYGLRFIPSHIPSPSGFLASPSLLAAGPDRPDAVGRKGTMAKEICISSTPHETRLAILEDDQLAEIYYERENEYTLAGSIYNGRVTRVLPGMQSAFVDVGLERDAFLYVTDFLELEDPEEADELEKAAVTGGAQPPREIRHPERAEGNAQTARNGGRPDDRGSRNGQKQEPRQDRSANNRGLTIDSAPESAEKPASIPDSQSSAEQAEYAQDESGPGAKRWRGRRRRRGGRGPSGSQEGRPESDTPQVQQAAASQFNPAPEMQLQDNFAQSPSFTPAPAVAPAQRGGQTQLRLYSPVSRSLNMARQRKARLALRRARLSLYARRVPSNLLLLSKLLWPGMAVGCCQASRFPGTVPGSRSQRKSSPSISMASSRMLLGPRRSKTFPFRRTRRKSRSFLPKQQRLRSHAKNNRLPTIPGTMLRKPSSMNRQRTSRLRRL